MANFWYLLLEWNAVGACLAWARFYTDRRTKQIYRVATFVPAVAVVINQKTLCNVLQRTAKKYAKTYIARVAAIVLFIKPFVCWRSRCCRGLLKVPDHDIFSYSECIYLLNTITVFEPKTRLKTKSRLQNELSVFHMTTSCQPCWGPTIIHVRVKPFSYVNTLFCFNEFAWLLAIHIGSWTLWKMCFTVCWEQLVNWQM